MNRTASDDPPRFSVVIADDVAELRSLLRLILETSERFDVAAEAADGREAISLVEEHLPDLLLLDISMPVMDGLEALPLLREAAPRTKIVVLSGFDGESIGERSLELGAAAYLEKGVPPATLVGRLLEVMDPGGTDGAVAPPPSPLTDFSAEDMMSLVAHEIRNPLAVIQGFGNELQTRWSTMADEQRLDAVKRMTERARYLNTIVSNLMYMRKVSAEGRPSLKEQDLRSLIEAVGDELKDLARGHEIAVSIPDDLPSVLVDMPRIRQVLTNLIVNAAKFAPKGTAIRITALRAGDEVVIEVADDGPGIPVDKREVVFEKFYRLEKGGSGIGLGLFISRALMTSMKGELHAVGDGPGARLRCRLRTA